MPIIRQEINIINGNAGGASGVVLGANGYVQLDTAQYSSPVYYFEAIVGTSSAASTLTLRRIGTTTDDATINTTSTGRLRSSSFSPPGGKTVYGIFSANTTIVIKAARIIIVDTSSSLTQTETQIEIGDNQAITATTDTALTNAKYWTWTTANWNGTVTLDAEVSYKTASSNTATITVQEDNGSFASWASKITIVSAVSNTSVTRTRTTLHFTPTATGRHYRLAVKSSTTKSSVTVLNAKIIVSSQPLTDAYLIASNINLLQAQGGTAGSGETFQALGQSFTTTANYSTTSISLKLLKVASPVDNVTLEILSGSITGTVLGTSNTVASSSLPTPTADYVSFTFGTAVALSNATKYYLRLTRSGARDTTNYPAWVFTNTSAYANGGQYQRDNNVWSSESATQDLAFIVYSNLSVTLIEPQYLLLNTADGGTGLQNYPTLWDSTEWSGVSNNYEYSHDATNAADSSKLNDITTTVDVSGATVTGANQQISAAFAMPASNDQLDSNVTVSTGVVGATRVIVVCALATPIGKIIQLNQAVNRSDTY